MESAPTATRARVPAILAALCGALLFVLIGAAEAALADTRTVHLRVEARPAADDHDRPWTGTLEPGRGYQAGTVRTLRAFGPDCHGREGKPRFPGFTPIGALGLAGRHNDALAPLRMRSTDWGWQLCRVGSGPRRASFGEWPGASGGWLFRVNGAPGTGAMDAVSVRAGDRVLVYYAIFPEDPASGGPPMTTAPLHNGRELALRQIQPYRQTPGEPFTVRVAAFGDDGQPQFSQYANIEVRGGDAPAPAGGDGFATVTVSEPGIVRLRAVHTQPRPGGAFGPEHDIPSEPVEFCVRHNPANCPRARGTLIRGTPRDDRIRATPGDDVIRAGPGADVINLRPGGRNRVFCGRGNDTVIINRGERRRNTFRNCNRIVAR